MSTTYLTSQSNTGFTTLTVAAGPGTVWNLTSLEVSQSGGVIGPNAKLTVWDGAVGGTALYSCFLTGPNQAGVPTGGSVGWVQKINIPTDALGRPGLQALPNNAMNIQVV